MQAFLQQQLELATLAHQRGDLASARVHYGAVLKARPNDVNCLHMLGVVAAQSGDFQRAGALMGQAIALEPADATLHANLGNVKNATGDFLQAISSFDRAIELQPDFAQAYSNRGNALVALRDFAAAVTSYERAIALVPKYADAHFNKGVALHHLGDFQAAVRSFDEVIALSPQHAIAHEKRGLALQALSRSSEALVSLSRAVTLAPASCEFRMHRGDLLHELGRLQEALADYDQAVATEPQNPQAHDHRAIVLRDLSRMEEAVIGHRRAIQLRPDYAEAHNNCGVALAALGRLSEAATHLARAVELRPDFAVSLLNLGNAQREMKLFDSALASYEQARAVAPSLAFLAGELQHTRMHLCEWEGWDESTQEISTRILSDERAATPFTLLPMLDTPEVHAAAARMWAKDHGFTLGNRIPESWHTPRGRVRIAYFSPDFREHPVSHLIAGLIEAHDRQRFEVFGFSYGAQVMDPMRKRLASAFDRFIDIHAHSDPEVVRMARELEIDIAIDLAGYTGSARPGIFAARCAPAQAAYLGYPGTMGSNAWDHVIADQTLIPEAEQSHFTEKIVYLPHSFMAYDRGVCISERPMSRRELGLPEDAFVFCCFNGGFKITPDCFDTWMRVLKGVPQSVLWLRQEHPQSTANLRQRAERAGVKAERLVFAERMPGLSEHLARYRLADLFLDSWPYNAHTTACDALWAGLPLLTCAGRSFASRVGASLLEAIELPELIADSPATFEALALALAMNPDRLKSIRARLSEHRLTRPLFDTQGFARRLEDALLQMHRRRLDGLPPEHIHAAS